jgi:hypothetical protein
MASRSRGPAASPALWQIVGALSGGLIGLFGGLFWAGVIGAAFYLLRRSGRGFDVRGGLIDAGAIALCGIYVVGGFLLPVQGLLAAAASEPAAPANPAGLMAFGGFFGLILGGVLGWALYHQRGR